MKFVYAGSPEHVKYQESSSQSIRLIDLKLGRTSISRGHVSRTGSFNVAAEEENIVYVIQEGWEVKEGAIEVGGKTFSKTCMLREDFVNNLQKFKLGSKEYEEQTGSEFKCLVREGLQEVIYYPNMFFVLQPGYDFKYIGTTPTGRLVIKSTHLIANKITIGKSLMSFHLILHFSDGSQEKFQLHPSAVAKNPIPYANIDSAVKCYNDAHPSTPIPAIFSSLSWDRLKATAAESGNVFPEPKFESEFVMKVVDDKFMSTEPDQITICKAGTLFYLKAHFSDNSEQKFMLIPTALQTAPLPYAKMRDAVKCYNDAHQSAKMPTIFSTISFTKLREAAEAKGQVFTEPKYQSEYSMDIVDGKAVPHIAEASGVTLESLSTALDPLGLAAVSQADPATDDVQVGETGANAKYPAE